MSCVSTCFQICANLTETRYLGLDVSTPVLFKRRCLLYADKITRKLLFNSIYIFKKASFKHMRVDVIAIFNVHKPI